MAEWLRISSMTDFTGGMEGLSVISAYLQLQNE
jgi:hypothetical protein